MENHAKTLYDKAKQKGFARCVMKPEQSSNMNAPTRIWVDQPRHGAMTNVYVESSAPNPRAVEYVRADLLLVLEKVETRDMGQTSLMSANGLPALMSSSKVPIIVEDKSITVKFTKSDAKRLIEVLHKAREPIAGTVAAVFLLQMIEDIERATSDPTP